MSNITECDKLIQKIVVLDEEGSAGGKRHYRLSDVIHHLGYYWKESTHFILNQPRFQGSILRDYIERCPDKNLVRVNKHYKELVLDIIQEKRMNFSLPEKDELVIHLRLGDFVEHPTLFLKKDYLTCIRKICSKTHITKITFCTAFHYGNNIHQKAWIYTDEKHEKNIAELKRLFTTILDTITIPVDIKSSLHPDDDFVYMVMADHFIQDVGGFSSLIAELRELDRNTRRIKTEALSP